VLKWRELSTVSGGPFSLVGPLLAGTRERTSDAQKERCMAPALHVTSGYPRQQALTITDLHECAAQHERWLEDRGRPASRHAGAAALCRHANGQRR